MNVRVFQVGNIYRAHLRQLLHRLDSHDSYSAIHAEILSEVAQAQILEPCLDGSEYGALCFPQYDRGLRQWAKQKGMRETATEEDIVLAQIEDHRTEVFYSINSTRHSKEFLERMPGSVRLKVAWLGSNPVGSGLQLFDAIVSNFPTLNARHAQLGYATFYQAPSFEPQIDLLGALDSCRHIDLFFAGTFSRHHTARANLLTNLANLVVAKGYNARFHLLNSRYTTLAEHTPLGLIQPFRSVRRPRILRRLARPPLFGRNMFRSLASAKFVINIAVDVADQDRGNMRCFETLSAGSVMISDAGNYPKGFESGRTHLTYRDTEEALALIDNCLSAPEQHQHLGANGAEMLRQRYSKSQQWAAFMTLCEQLIPA